MTPEMMSALGRVMAAPPPVSVAFFTVSWLAILADTIVFSEDATTMFLFGVLILLILALGVTGVIYTEWALDRRQKLNARAEEAVNKQLTEAHAALLTRVERSVTDRLDRLLEATTATDLIYARQVKEYKDQLEEYRTLRVEVTARLQSIDDAIKEVKARR